MNRFTILFFTCLSVFNPFFPVLADDAEIRALRKEVGELKAIVEKLTQGQAQNKVEITQIKPKPHSDFDAPTLKMQGFGHLQYDYANQSFRDRPDRDTNHFTNGNLGFTITSQISKKLSFLNETLFRFQQNGNTNLNVERVLLKYEHASWLNISIGREHTPLGYWNQHYHHARWMMTSTDRPVIYRVETNDGILPMHYVGLGVFGDLGFDFGDIEYSVAVGNGRGRDTRMVQLIKDDNDEKQIATKFTIKPSALEGFGVGASFLYDVIPNDLGVIGRENEIEEIIAGGHLYYTGEPYELIAEYKHIRHDDSRSVKSHHGGYIQFAYSINKFKPYYRIGFLEIASNDAYFAGLNGIEDSLHHTVGLRYEWFPFAAIKLEYRRMDSRSEDSNSVTSQVSFIY